MKGLFGFTLTELIVVLALVVLSSTIVIFNYRGSRQGVVLSATALDVANMVRIAQTGGRSAAQNVSNFNATSELVAGTTSDTVRSGIHMSIASNRISTFTVYKGFDGVTGYTPGSGDSPLEIKNISANGVILRLCTDGVPTTPGACTGYGSSAVIEFSRLQSDPILDAGYKTQLGNNQPTIQLESSVGDSTMYRYVVIEQTGNIFVR